MIYPLVKLACKMFGVDQRAVLRGPGYVILNIIRVLNIISLVLIVIASWVMLVKTVMTSSFFFFDGASHVITSTIAAFLIITELPFFKSYFARTWPKFGIESGFVFLALSMIALGFNILGNLNKPATSQENLGMPFWRIVIASGILTAIMGFLNLLATYIFSDSEAGISARQVRSHGASIDKMAEGGKTFSLSSGSTRRPHSPVLPSYNPPPTEERRKSVFGFKLPIRMSQISRPVPTQPDQFEKFNSRSSPVMPHVERPPTALHPMHNTGRNETTPAYPASSRYSTVSNMTRF